MGMNTIPQKGIQLYKLCHYPFSFSTFSLHHSPHTLWNLQQMKMISCWQQPPSLVSPSSTPELQPKSSHTSVFLWAHSKFWLSLVLRYVILFFWRHFCSSLFIRKNEMGNTCFTSGNSWHGPIPLDLLDLHYFKVFL